ncbi:nucleoside triphosphate pyrophosphatase [Arenimonas sp.]|uniref:Maf family protein n=1 Tax=Arenimonas sp. TaxID=1872635 RepID=UPI002E36124B|nr:nucleoside triphosphate pyrophosphatase [Arenimonas sp.]HEX4853720.1 nucleoside triphosphate pyrophosphatase [Arenimonas sp.]
MTPLVLASTSRYRRELLARLGLPFTVDRPDVDETPRPDEAPADLARRLAEAKAREVAHHHPGAWVLGSDQVADRDGRPLGKPGNRDTAFRQLAAASGREVRFHTAFCLIRDDGPALAGLDETRVRFRALDDDAILRYLDAEQPYDCAGSFKCEGLGISLFEAIENRDPTALVGLPLIAVADALRRAGYRLP